MKNLKEMTNEELIQLARSGNENAQDVLLKRNMKLVMHYARKWFKRGYSKDLVDLISLGKIGLFKAYKNYSPNMKTKFSTLAVTYIKNEFLKNMYYNNHQKRICKYDIFSLDEKVKNAKEKGGNFEYHDVIKDEHSEDKYINVERNIYFNQVRNEFFRIATEHEKYVFDKYFKDGLTYDEIAKELGISRQRAFQIGKQCIEKIKNKIIYEISA